MLNYSANGPSGYNLTNSLRFRASASAYLSRTPASASNRQIWTWSGWIKRGSLGTDQAIFSVAGSTNTTYFLVKFDTNNCIYIGNYSTNFFVTTQTFRDPSAWYHIVVVLDTTQATANNRLKLYVNGVQVTAFSSNNIAAQIAQNSDQGINASAAHNIGREALGGVFALDGYQDEINFINAQALTPSSFGNYNSVTGVWQPAKYTGAYGTNGYYLNFSNIALTSGFNTGLGQDYSGNGNYWNTNNISVTSGTTYDAMSDVPTLTSTTTANYCVVSPIAFRTTTPAPTITNGNLTVVCSSATASAIGSSTFGVSSNKWYFEATKTGTAYGNIGVALAPFSQTISALKDFGSESNEYAYINNGNKYNNNSSSAYGSSWTNGDVIGVALDLDNGTLTFYKNGVSQGVAYSSLPSGTYIVGCYDSYNGSGFEFNFGQRPFAYTAPSGYLPLNTYNLPTSTIVQGNKYMDATLYTGTNANLTITNAGAFKPDLVWLKIRDISGNHQIVDSVRGVTKVIDSNTTGAEQTATAGTGLTAFNTNGFSLGTDTTTDGYTNRNGSTFVAWQWQAGQGSTSSNTSGSITSTVSVNASAGFSVVTYTGNGSATGATVGHGLGVAPKMIIVKDRTTSDNWLVQHASTGATGYLNLNGTGAFTTTARAWNNTAPTSSVFTVNTIAGEIWTNKSADNYVAYCWAEIAGFSRFGSYTGNGSADGPFIYTGFRPKFVMVKLTSAATDGWFMYDTSRSTYNVADWILQANSSNADAQGSTVIDILSNGFKARSSFSGSNSNGATYIYAVFAENPFKNALAR